MRLDSSAPVPLYQQVAADLRRRIASGDMPVGLKIPPHKELAVEYGVSVITINKALSGLVSDGLLHSHVGRGTFVMVRPASITGVAAPTTIGFVLRDLSSPFFSLIAHSAQQRADDLGVGLVLASSSNRLDREEEQIRRLRFLGVSGLIIVSMSRTFRLSESIQALHDEDFPYTMVSWTAGDDVPFVGLDLAEAGHLAAQHLLQLGHTKFGYLIDRIGSLNGELRMSRYRSTIEEAGLKINPAFVFEHSVAYEIGDYKSGYAAGQAIARLKKRPEAMYCFNDLGALGLEDALLDAGLDVPGDVSIIGIDDIELSSRSRVPLTTVRQPVDIIGARSVDTLLARLRGERPPVRQIFPARLIVRASCGAPATASTAAVSA